MDRNSTINDILKAAGKASAHQKIQIVHEIDGVECFDESDDKNDIAIVLTNDTSELQKKIDEGLCPNEKDREADKKHLDELLTLKAEWLNKQA